MVLDSETEPISLILQGQRETQIYLGAEFRLGYGAVPEMEVGLRSRLVGAGFKQPQAAAQLVASFLILASRCNS